MGRGESSDAVPAELLTFAHAALDGRRIDSELAELTFDSVLDTASGKAERRLEFRATAVSIELQVERAGEGRTLLGRLAPAAVTRIEVQVADGTIVSSGETDANGRFGLVLAQGGRARLRLVPATRGVPLVETSWVTV